MSLLMLLCPLGMAAMGGVAWVLTRLPGKRAERTRAGSQPIDAACRWVQLNRNPPTKALCGRGV